MFAIAVAIDLARLLVHDVPIPDSLDLARNGRAIDGPHLRPIPLLIMDFVRAAVGVSLGVLIGVVVFVPAPVYQPLVGIHDVGQIVSDVFIGEFSVARVAGPAGKVVHDLDGLLVHPQVASARVAAASACDAIRLIQGQGVLRGNAIANVNNAHEYGRVNLAVVVGAVLNQRVDALPNIVRVRPALDIAWLNAAIQGNNGQRTRETRGRRECHGDSYKMPNARPKLSAGHDNSPSGTRCSQYNTT